MTGLLVILCCWLAIFWHPTSTLWARLRPSLFPNRVLFREKHVGPLNFLTIGDWGRKGLYNQTLVAHQMAKIGKKMGISFVISTGDNFYDKGLKSPHDPLFLQSFKNIYTDKSLQVPWYTVLGNHDYKGDVSVQIDPLLRKIDERWFCNRNYVLKKGLADIFFIDTTPFVDEYFQTEKTKAYDWRGVLPRETYTMNTLNDLENELKKSSARWKMVVGHHPILSIGSHSNTMELVTSLLPILKENGVDMYMNGHNHCLEHLTTNPSSIHFFTSGAGSKTDETMPKLQPIPNFRVNVNCYHEKQGFMSVGVSHSNVNITFFDLHGRVLHNASLLKD